VPPKRAKQTAKANKSENMAGRAEKKEVIPGQNRDIKRRKRRPTERVSYQSWAKEGKKEMVKKKKTKKL